MRTTFEELKLNTDKVFLQLREFNLKCNPVKCKWFVTTIKFLDLEVTSQGVKPNAENA